MWSIKKQSAAERRRLSFSKILFEKLSNVIRFAAIAFEKAARCGAHKFCTVGAKFPHLHRVECFARRTRRRAKPIHILFRRARRNSTRFCRTVAPLERAALFYYPQRSFVVDGCAKSSAPTRLRGTRVDVGIDPYEPQKIGNVPNFIRQIFNGRSRGDLHSVSCGQETRFYGRPKGVRTTERKTKKRTTERFVFCA